MIDTYDVEYIRTHGEEADVDFLDKEEQGYSIFGIVGAGNSEMAVKVESPDRYKVLLNEEDYEEVQLFLVEDGENVPAGGIVTVSP